VVPKDVSLIRGGYSEEDLALAKPLMPELTPAVAFGWIIGWF
jgi:hypothetical protein